MKLLPSLVLALAAAIGQTEAQTNRAILDVGARRGTAQQLASGVLYGTPDTLNQIPDRFYTETKIKYFRAGGAQLFNVGQRGWHIGEYVGRFESTLSNYRTARKYGGEFQLLPHDIWGTDTAVSGTPWPGDNGDWSDYNRFLDYLFRDIKANNMVPGLKWDIWNEPNLDIFWKRPLQQWLQLWKITYDRLKADPVMRNVPIIGPSLAWVPHPNDPWWSEWMRFIAQNNCAPDQYSFHILGPSTDRLNDLEWTVQAMNDFYASTGAPRRPYTVNEYINSGDERQNAANAWHIARLERYDATGLRANWLSTWELHDFLAELVWRPNANSQYQPNGAWWMYRYYAQDMVGTRLTTTGSTDGILDIFSTLGNDGVVRVLTGIRRGTGTWEIEVRNLAALGFPANGSVRIQTWGFDDVGLRGVSNGPSNRGIVEHQYTGGVLRFPIFQTTQDRTTAWAFEIRRA